MQNDGGTIEDLFKQTDILLSRYALGLILTQREL